jgi:hypothetical protein
MLGALSLDPKLVSDLLEASVQWIAMKEAFDVEQVREEEL